MPSTTRRRRDPAMRGNQNDQLTMTQARITLGGISQQEMGELLGITQGAVGHIEQGRTPLAAWVRRDIGRLLVQYQAARIAATGRSTRCAEGEQAVSNEYLQHMEGCARCSAHAIVMRALQRGRS